MKFTLEKITEIAQSMLKKVLTKYEVETFEEDDLLHELIMRVLKYKVVEKEFESEDYVIPYIRQVLNNLAVDELKKSNVNHQQFNKGNENDEFTAVEMYEYNNADRERLNPHRTVERHLDLDTFMKLLDKQKLRLKKVKDGSGKLEKLSDLFELKLQGYTYSEIAQILAIHYKSVCTYFEKINMLKKDFFKS